MVLRHDPAPRGSRLSTKIKSRIKAHARDLFARKGWAAYVSSNLEAIFLEDLSNVFLDAFKFVKGFFI